VTWELLASPRQAGCEKDHMAEGKQRKCQTAPPPKAAGPDECLLHASRRFWGSSPMHRFPATLALLPGGHWNNAISVDREVLDRHEVGWRLEGNGEPHLKRLGSRL
jgi:hypothetical protein